MSSSLKDFLDFVLLWLKKRTGVHLHELVIYPAMVRHCLCCHKDGRYAHETNGLCGKCCREQGCAVCGESFTPSLDSVGVFCPTCWAGLEATWTTTFREDPVRADQAIRSRVTSARPSLIGCRHV